MMQAEIASLQKENKSAARNDIRMQSVRAIRVRNFFKWLCCTHKATIAHCACVRLTEIFSNISMSEGRMLEKNILNRKARRVREETQKALRASRSSRYMQLLCQPSFLTVGLPLGDSGENKKKLFSQQTLLCLSGLSSCGQL